MIQRVRFPGWAGAHRLIPLLLWGPLIAGCGGGDEADREAAGTADQRTDVAGSVAVPASLGSDTHPDWSARGNRIAFISNREGMAADTPINFEVYTTTVMGGADNRLTENTVFEADVRWSPDGRHILFKSMRDGNDEIYVMDMLGGDPTNLTNHPASDGGGTWSPDGATILFASNRGEEGMNRLYVMDRDGGNVRPLPHDPGPGHSPDWGPTGRIAFVSTADGNGEICVANADGSDMVRITIDPRENGYPRWSPDGEFIAHTAGSFRTDQWSVVITDPDGANAEEPMEGNDSGNVTWSPDGTKIMYGKYTAYGDNGGEKSRLFLFDLNQGEETALVLEGRE